MTDVTINSSVIKEYFSYQHKDTNTQFSWGALWRPGLICGKSPRLYPDTCMYNRYIMSSYQTGNRLYILSTDSETNRNIWSDKGHSTLAYQVWNKIDVCSMLSTISHFLINRRFDLFVFSSKAVVLFYPKPTKTAFETSKRYYTYLYFNPFQMVHYVLRETESFL